MWPHVGSELFDGSAELLGDRAAVRRSERLVHVHAPGTRDRRTRIRRARSTAAARAAATSRSPDVLPGADRSRPPWQSSMSVAVPIHFSSSSSAPRIGEAAERVPSVLPVEPTNADVELERGASRERRASTRLRQCSASSGCTSDSQSHPSSALRREPAYVVAWRLKYSVEPSGAAVHTMCGIDSAISRKPLRWLSPKPKPSSSLVSEP